MILWGKHAADQDGAERITTVPVIKRDGRVAGALHEMLHVLSGCRYRLDCPIPGLIMRPASRSAAFFFFRALLPNGSMSSNQSGGSKIHRATKLLTAKAYMV